MTAPPFLIGAALAFWGWQTGHLAAAILLGIALEAPRYLRLRLDLGAAEHSRIADLSTVGFVALAALLAANQGVSSGILQAFIWVPATLAPIMAAQMFSESGRIPLSALFRYMRKLKRRQPEVRDPMVDVSAVYAALVVISAGVANARGPGYYAGVVLITAWLLLRVRPRRAHPAAWALMLAAGAGAGYAGQIGIAQMQAALEGWILELNLRGLDADPYRSITEIGSIGRLKQYDAIVLRVYAADADLEHVRLLHRASYNTYAGTTWLAREAPMRELEPERDNTTWTLQPGRPAWHVRIAARVRNGKALLPLPAGTTRIEDLTALSVRRNALGAVHADLGAEWIRYRASGGAGIEDYGPPTAADRVLPSAEQQVFQRVASRLDLRSVPPEEAVRRVARYLSGFRYSLYRERPVPKGETALGDFLTRRHAGHCEYFAAATALLLRAAGIPSRYAVGYAVEEYSALERAYVVRSRHAHAWARAWVGGRWVDLDNTPPDWVAEEAAEAPFWERLADFARWAGFRWTMREEFKAGEGWYAVLAALFVILVWRLLRGRKVVREGAAPAAARVRWPGEDSEFYALERTLPPRDSAETHAAWLTRVSKELPKGREQQVRIALALHQRYRFDPQGLTAGERGELRELCRMLAAEAK
jgi:protein-glutamine gamma-glutamyltransferase